MEGQLPAPLSFSLLEARINQLSDGPVGILKTPPWMLRLNAVGVVGIVVGLLPSLLIKFFEPQIWMMWLARGGVIVVYAAWMPYILRSAYALIRDAFRFRASAIEQLDHDRLLFAEWGLWLAGFPREVVEDHLQFVQHAQTRLAAKIGLLAGGVDKLGMLPALVAAFIALRSWKDLLALPAWLACLAIFLVVTWMIGWLAANLRLRFQLYEVLLTDAVKIQAGSDSKPIDLLSSSQAAGGRMGR